jgi:Bacterial PH domain
MTHRFLIARSEVKHQEIYRECIALGGALISFTCISFVAHQFRFGLIFGVGLYLLVSFSLRFFDRSKKVVYEISSTHLAIKGDMFGDSIALTSLNFNEMCLVDISGKVPQALKWKLWGTGLPGYYSGEYALRSGERALVFVSDKKRVVYIPRMGADSLLLSVDNPDLFMLALRSRVEIQNAPKLA